MLTGIVLEILDFEEPGDKFTIQDRVVNNKFILDNPLEVLYDISFNFWQSADHECFVRGFVFSCTYTDNPMNRVKELNDDFEELADYEKRGVICMCQFNHDISVEYIIFSRESPDIYKDVSNISRFNYFHIVYHSRGIFEKAADLYNDAKGVIHFPDIMRDPSLEEFLTDYKDLYGCLPGEEDIESDED